MVMLKVELPGYSGLAETQEKMYYIVRWSENPRYIQQQYDAW